MVRDHIAVYANIMRENLMGTLEKMQAAGMADDDGELTSPEETEAELELETEQDPDAVVAEGEGEATLSLADDDDEQGHQGRVEVPKALCHSCAGPGARPENGQIRQIARMRTSGAGWTPSRKPP